MGTKGTIYKVIFLNHGHLYEIYAKDIRQSALQGFIEVAALVFDEQQLVQDEAEERLKTEFAEVIRSFIPLHAMVRIDEVNKKGVAKIIDLGPVASNVHHFPIGGSHPDNKPHKD